MLDSTASAGCAADRGGGRWQFFAVILWLFLGNPSLCIPPLQDDGKHFGKVSGTEQNACILDFTIVLQLELFPCSLNPNL